MKVKKFNIEGTDVVSVIPETGVDEGLLEEISEMICYEWSGGTDIDLNGGGSVFHLSRLK